MTVNGFNLLIKFGNPIAIYDSFIGTFSTNTLLNPMSTKAVIIR